MLGMSSIVVDGYSYYIATKGALTSLNVSRNDLRAKGAKHVAEAIKVNVSALRFFWYHFFSSI